MRTAFISELIIQARKNGDIFLVVGDLGFSVVEPFAAEFPARFLNAGVAEQNMTGVAAGLASEGYHVFTYSIGNFPTFRCAEQIRNDVAYHKLAVTIVAVGGGLAYGNLGYSHHAVQDMALMRSMPGLMLCCPGDPFEARSCVRYLAAHPQPSYLRIAKAGEPCLHAAPPDVVPGMFLPVIVRAGARRTLLTTGAALNIACIAAADPSLPEPWDVFSLPLWNDRVTKENLAKWIESYEQVFVPEDHLQAGGFCSFLCECLNGQPDAVAKIRGFALDSLVCGLVGRQSALQEKAGLSAKALVAAMTRRRESAG
jgi:transketolase